MYPIAYSAQYEAEDRNRLTVFLRYIMLIPLMIVGFFYAIGAYVSAIVAWFSIVFSGEYPAGAYNFNAGFIHFAARVNGYANLLTDEYPSFGREDGLDYPVRTIVDPALPAYDRAKTGFRFLLLIPVMLIGYLMGAILGICSIIAWFAILFTGRFPDGLYGPIRATSAWQAKAGAYALLVTEEFPPFWVEEEEEAPRFGAAGSVPALDDPYATPAADPYAAPSGEGTPPPPPPPQ